MDYNCKEMRKKIDIIVPGILGKDKKRQTITSLKQLNTQFDGLIDHVLKHSCQCLYYYSAVRRKILKKKG